MRGLLLLCALALGTSCARRAIEPPAAVRDVRRAEAALGFEPTRNFHREGGKQAYYLCYAAGLLELPRDYSGLRVDQGRDGSCRFDPVKLDVFVYPAEALAGRRAPVTGALAEAEPERRDFVVAHEDFHEQPGVRGLDPALKEAVSMLAGLLASAEAARLRHDEAAAARALAEADRFLEKARLVNSAHAELSDVYDRYARGAISREHALRSKADLFARLERECSAGGEPPRAFHPCPAALNNAGLAFDATYTREYPRVHAMFVQSGRDPRKAIAGLKRLASSGQPSAQR